MFCKRQFVDVLTNFLTLLYAPLRLIIANVFKTRGRIQHANHFRHLRLYFGSFRGVLQLDLCQPAWFYLMVIFWGGNSDISRLVVADIFDIWIQNILERRKISIDIVPTGDIQQIRLNTIYLLIVIPSRKQNDKLEIPVVTSN